jgi:transcription elongation factor Elf1
MKSKKKSLRKSKKVVCPECGSDEIEFDLIDVKNKREFNECQDCGTEFVDSKDDGSVYT